MKNRRLVISLIQLAFALIILLLWEIAGRESKDIYFLLGTPTAIASEFLDLLFKKQLLSHFFTTGSEALLGLIIGTLLGSICGLFLWYSETIAAISQPFVIGLSTLPIFAFAPLMIVWFGVDLRMKVALSAFSTVFVAFNQTHRGALLVGGEYVEMIRGMNASKTATFVKVVVPGAFDWVLSSMRLNVGFALLGAFIGEFISADRGLGYLILRAGGLYNIPRAFAASIGIIVLALIMDFGAQLIEKKRYAVIQLLSVPRRLWR